MRFIEQFTKLLAFMSPAVLAWFVCPLLIEHGSSAAFQLAIWLVVVAMFSSAWGILTVFAERR